jgi:regulator of protease activity HflC (stomatin/prohibitin superfamily)
MKKFLVLAMIALIGLMFMSCNQFMVPSGHVGIIIDLYGSEKGVQPTVLLPGRYNLNLNQEGHLYPTFISQYAFTESKDEGSPTNEATYFSNKDGIEAHVDLAIQAAVIPNLVPVLFQKYREDFDEVLHKQIRTRMRDFFNEFGAPLGIDELYGPKRNDLLKKVKDSLVEEFAPQGIQIETLSYLSKTQFNEKIETQISLKVENEQAALAAQNALKTAQANAKNVAAKAQGEADSNRILAQSLSPEILKLKELQNQEKFIEALAAGKATMPSTYVTSGTNTLIPLK